MIDDRTQRGYRTSTPCVLNQSLFWYPLRTKVQPKQNESLFRGRLRVETRVEIHQALLISFISSTVFHRKSASLDFGEPQSRRQLQLKNNFTPLGYSSQDKLRQLTFITFFSTLLSVHYLLHFLNFSNTYFYIMWKSKNVVWANPHFG